MAGPRKAASTDEGTAVKDARLLVVEARYYESIADELLAGAKRALDAAQAEYDVVTVPGALEIAQAIVISLDAAKRKAPYEGVVALGCVIRGETSHYDIVASESAGAIMDIAVWRGMPVGNGILTVDTEAQALARARADGQDKGAAAAEAALTLVRLKRSLVKPKPRSRR